MTRADICWKRIPLTEISPSRRWNLHPWSAATIGGELLASLKRSGIVHPPYLIGRGEQCYEIVAGHRRCSYASLAGQETILALILPEKTEIHALLDLIFADQTLARPLSLPEKARFISICRKQLESEEQLPKFLGLLQLHRKSATLGHLDTLLHLDQEILEAIDQQYVQEKMAIDLLRLGDPEDILAVIRLFRQLQIGDNQQRKLISALRDLCRREQQSLASYLQQSPEIAAILTHENLNPPQKVQHLGRLLQERLSPEMTQADQAFDDRIKQLRLPANISLHHSPAFESNHVDLRITFGNLEDCIARLPAVQEALHEKP